MIQVTAADRPTPQAPPSSLVTHLYKDNVPCLVRFLSFSSRPTCPVCSAHLCWTGGGDPISLEVFGTREARRSIGGGSDPLSHEQCSSKNTVPFSQAPNRARSLGPAAAGSMASVRWGLIYRSFDHSLGAAHAVAQWARWKTGRGVLSAWRAAWWWRGAFGPLLAK